MAEATKGADRYEARYMPTRGELLHRERMVQQYHWVMGIVTALAGLAALGAIGAAAAGAMPLAPALLTLLAPALFGTLWVLFSVLRVHLSSRELLIQLGPFGPRIPVASIVSSAVVQRVPGRYGGGKVRIGLDGSREYWFMMNTTLKELVEVTFRDGGKVHRVVLSSEDPARLVSAIEHARQRVDAPAGVRVADVATDAPAARAHDEQAGAVDREAHGAERGSST